MKKLFILLMGIALIACNAGGGYPKAESDLDAAREFIDAFLKGDSKRATAYMVDDEENRAILSRLHSQLKNRSRDDQQGYRDSNIEIGSREFTSEDEVVIQYKATYDKIPRKVKVVRVDGAWLVDLKYILNPNL